MDSLTALDGSQTSAPSFEDCSSFAPSSAALQGSDRAVERGGGGEGGEVYNGHREVRSTTYPHHLTHKLRVILQL